MRADITYSTDDTKSNFVAETPAGEAFLRGPELIIPNDQADECLAKAIATGLSVVSVPFISAHLHLSSNLPPLKWSSLKYVFRMEDKIDGKEEAYG